MKQEIVMRGQTATGLTEVLEFSGIQIENKNMAYKMTEFEIFPSTNIVAVSAEMVASVTAAKSAEDPLNPNFNNPGLIASAFFTNREQSQTGYHQAVVNDTYLVTQNLLLKVECAEGPVNWQCRFKAVKMNDAEMAANNFKQYTISDGS
jgi:spore coat protein CotH